MKAHQQLIKAKMLDWIAEGNKLITCDRKYPLMFCPDRTLEKCARELVLAGQIKDCDLK